MQNIYDRLISQLRAQGKSEGSASEIAKSTLVKSGSLTPTGTLTAKGMLRSAMGASGRAKDRAAKASAGRHSKADYLYSSKNNRATLR